MAGKLSCGDDGIKRVTLTRFKMAFFGEGKLAGDFLLENSEVE